MKKSATLLAMMVFASCAIAYENVSVEDFARLAALPESQVLDVRTFEEYEEGHIPSAYLADIRQDGFLQKVQAMLSKDKPVLVYCRTGVRSTNACAVLADAGFKVYNLEKGITAWKETGKEITTADMKKVFEFIKACGTYYLATVDKDQPRVRPFGTVNIFEDKFYIQTGHKKDVAKQIDANGKVEICAFNGKEWIRLSGILVSDERIEAKKSMLDAHPELRGMYSETDPNTAVYYFKNATARICSFTNPEEIIHF